MMRNEYCEAVPGLRRVSGHVGGLCSGAASRDSFLGRRGRGGYECAGNELGRHHRRVNGVLMAFLKGVR